MRRANGRNVRARHSTVGIRHSTERAGFEPAVPLRVHVLSRHAHSAALAPLRKDRIQGVKGSRVRHSNPGFLESSIPIRRPAYPMLPGCQTRGYFPKPDIEPQSAQRQLRVRAGPLASPTLRSLWPLWLYLHRFRGYLMRTSVPGFTASTTLFSGIESSSM